MSSKEHSADPSAVKTAARRRSGLYLESTDAEQLGVLPHECIRVKDVMSRSVSVESPLTEIGEAVRLMKSLDVRVIIVCNGRTIVGTLSDREIALANAHSSEPICKVMTPHPACCCENDLLIDALAVMRARGFAALPVLNSSGLLSGIVMLTESTPRLLAEDNHIGLA